MQAVGAAAAGAMISRRKSRGVHAITRSRGHDSVDAEEAEMLAFEMHCQLLNTQQYKGFRRWQVEIWLLFEDQTSSTAAAVRNPPSPSSRKYSSAWNRRSHAPIAKAASP